MVRIKFTKFACDVCDRTLLQRQTYEAHMETHSEISSSKEKPFRCDACDKTFGSKAWLTRHQKTHSVIESGGPPNCAELDLDGPPRLSENGRQGQGNKDTTGFQATSGNMFMLLPREVWSMILGSIQYHTDLLNMLEAFPELDGVYKKEKQLTLFDQVIPFIAEWMEERDLLNCRLASKQWSIGVDRFLENHPFRRPSSPYESHGPGQVWDPIHYSKCYHGQRFPTIHPGQALYRIYLEHSYSFRDSEAITNFMLKMEGHPLEINPFIGRSVELRQEDGVDFWNNVLALLEKWGRHVWFLKIVRSPLQGVTHFLRSVQRSLRHVPNLKSLHINAYCGHSKPVRSKYINPGENVPALVHLETIQTSATTFAHPVVTKMLLPHYSNQIRRLELQFPKLDLVHGGKREYSAMVFPNLIELRITGIDTQDSRWINGVDNIILSIGAPQVHSLDLRISGLLLPEGALAHLKESEVFRWLERFPLLKHFQFPHERISIAMSDPGLPRPSTNTSLESISLHNATLKRDPDILLGFPALQCLQLCGNINVSNQPGNEKEQFRYCNAALNLDPFWEVWKKLDKLNVIIIITGEGDYQKRFRFLKGDVDKFLNKRGEIKYI